MDEFVKRINEQKDSDESALFESMRAINATINPHSKKEKVFLDEEENEIVIALNMILSFYNLPQIEKSKSQNATMETDYILDSTCMMRRQVKLEGKWWVKDAAPLLCFDHKTKKYVALIPEKGKNYCFYDSTLKKFEKVSRKNQGRFDTQAYCFYRPFTKDVTSVKSLFLNIIKVLSLHDVLYLFFISLIAALMGLIIPKVNQFIFNNVIPSGSKNDILPIASLLFGVVITTTLFNLSRSVWVARTGDKLRFVSESGVWDRILHLPVSFFKDFESGDLTQRAAMITKICDVISGGMIPVILTTIFSSVYLFQIGSFSTKLVMPTIFILGSILLVSIINSMIRIKINKRANIVSVKLSGLVYQLYSGIAKLKTGGAEVRAFSKWSELFADKIKTTFSPPAIVKYIDVFNQIIILSGTILIYWTVFKNNISVSDYIAFNTAYGCLLVAITQFAKIGSQIAYLKPALEMIEPILKNIPEEDSSKSQVTKLNGSIEFKNVCFRYQKDMDLVINNLSLSIKSGEYVALVGESGCGKSTLFRLLLGFETPEIGAIYYDEKDLSKLSFHSVRKRVGTVLQDGKLFSGDILSNISVCAPWITLDEAWEAAEKAGVKEEIEEMPMGMFTIISDSHGGVSGGQKQRLLIARALAMNPDILLFDEATSALDNIKQAKVIHTLKHMENTRLVIAHRLSTVKECDRILYMEHGQIVESGSYMELMELDGKFKQLAKRQLM